MNVIRLVILWLCAAECMTQIIHGPSKIDELKSSLAEATVEILSRCSEKEANTVGLAGILDGFPFETVRSQQTISLALIGNDTYGELVNPESRHKLQLFVVTGSSLNQIETTLRQIKRSLWWNHMATLLILDWQSAITEHGCSNAFKFLWAAWEMDLLKAMYLCVHKTNGRLVYSYNPFTNKAPDPWQLENTYKGKNDHPWTIFFREFDDDERICINLEFDKTNDLGGYKVYATAKQFPPGWTIDPNKKGVESLTGFGGHFTQEIFHALNATAHLKIHDHRQSPGLLDKNGNDIAMDTVSGISDFVIIPRFHETVSNFTVSYTFYESGVNILTQYSGSRSQLNKLLTVLDGGSRYGLGLVVMTTVVFFKCFLRQPLGTAILNTLRIIANSNLTKTPKNQGARIYLAGVFFLVVTIVGIYQGSLASLLTKSKPLPNVETMQDLFDRGYKIHGFKKYAFSFEDSVFKDRFIGHAYHNCTGLVIRDSSAACMASQLLISDDAVKFNLHRSNGRVIKSRLVYVIREDWNLEERFNKVLAALAEADITRYVLEKEMQETISIAHSYENLEKNRKCKVITLSELTFAFTLLGIGIACATVCFIVEVAISLFVRAARSRTRNVRCSIRNLLPFK